MSPSNSSQSGSVKPGTSIDSVESIENHEPPWWLHACFFGLVLLFVLGFSAAQYYLSQPH